MTLAHILNCMKTTLFSTLPTHQGAFNVKSTPEITHDPLFSGGFQESGPYDKHIIHISYYSTHHGDHEYAIISGVGLGLGLGLEAMRKAVKI